MNMTWQPIVALLLAGASAFAGAADLPAVEMKVINEMSPELITGSQPSRSDLEKLKATGVTTVINLRGTGEDAGFDEAATAKALGLHYVSIPVAGAGDVSMTNAAKLDAALKSADGKTLVHCASSNRVGALLALRAAAAGQSEEDAIAFGKSAGMTSLESAARAQIKAAAGCNPLLTNCP